MAQQNSKGICHFCRQEFVAAGMTGHLIHCPVWLERLQSPQAKSLPEVFHLKIWATYLKDYWLHLEVHSGAFLKDLDSFLRRLWLECCGHLSAFQIEGLEYQVETASYEDWWFGPRPHSMRVRTGKLFQPGLTFQYQYDFGTTTHLALKVIESRQGCFPKERVALIARNNAPVFECTQCGKPASCICAECGYDYDACCCDECTKAHLEHEECLMPLVNSPRAGVCGYMG